MPYFDGSLKALEIKVLAEYAHADIQRILLWTILFGELYILVVTIFAIKPPYVTRRPTDQSFTVCGVGVTLANVRIINCAKLTTLVG